MVGVTHSEVSLRNLIAKDPVKAQNKAKALLKISKNSLTIHF